MKPSVSSWDDADRLEDKQVILFDDKTRIRVRVPMTFASLSQMTAISEFSKIKIKTLETKSDGVDIALTESNCKLVAENGYSDIRIEFSRQQLKDLHLLPPSDEDGVPEKAWYDWGENSDSSKHNLSDGNAFNSAGSDKLRGRCTKYGALKDNPANSPYDKSFLRAAGVERITAEIGGAVSSIQQIANQADIFYISTEGHIATGCIEAGSQKEPFAAGDTLWKHELKTVIIAGCSVLAISDYRVSSMTRGDRFWYFIKTRAYYTNLTPPSPGIDWEPTGPKYLLGYCFTAPADTDGAAQIITSYMASVSSGINPVAAWGLANTGNKGNNACAIDTSVSPHQYWYFKSVDGKLVWTQVLKEVTGWPINIQPH